MDVRRSKIKRTGASARPHPRWSWAWPVTVTRPSLSGAVRRRGDGPETAHPAPAVPAETLSQALRHAGPPPPRTEETTP